jgi:hypothetical protein
MVFLSTHLGLGSCGDGSFATCILRHGIPETLRYQFETVSRMSEHEQQMIREPLDAVIVRNQVAGAIEHVVKQAPSKPAGRGTRERGRTAHQE